MADILDNEITDLQEDIISPEDLDSYLDEIARQKQEYILPQNIKKGVTIFNVDGMLDVSFSDATATIDDIILGKKAYIKDIGLVTGTIEEVESYTFTTTSSVYSADDGVTFRNLSGKSICLRNNAALFADNEIVRTAIRLTPDIIKKGESILGVTGTLEIGVDTTDANAVADDIAYGKMAYVKGIKLVGTIPDHDIDEIYEAGTTVSRETDGLLVTGVNSTKQILNVDDLIKVKTLDADIVKALQLKSNMLKQGVTLFGIQGNVEQIPSNTIRVTTNATTNKTNQVDVIGSSVVFTHTEPTKYTLVSPSVGYGYVIPDTTVANTIGLTADILKKDITVLGISGTYIGEAGTGTEDATATEEDILAGKTAYANKKKLTGTLETIDNTIDKKVGINTMSYNKDILTIETNNLTKAYKNGKISIKISAAQLAEVLNLDSSMIAQNTTVLGITGTYTGEGMLTVDEYNEILNMANSILPPTE